MVARTHLIVTLEVYCLCCCTDRRSLCAQLHKWTTYTLAIWSPTLPRAD